MRRVFNLFRSKDPVAERLNWLRANGRIVEGEIIELVGADGQLVDPKAEQPGPCYAHYEYSISGVTYESAQELLPEQIGQLENFLPGTAISVRYDPRSPGSSVME